MSDLRPFAELRDSGLLWLINRVVLHPRGFALALTVRDGEAVGWKLLGDGSEVWRFEGDEDDLFERAQQTLMQAAVPDAPGDQPLADWERGLLERQRWQPKPPPDLSWLKLEVVRRRPRWRRLLGLSAKREGLGVYAVEPWGDVGQAPVGGTTDVPGAGE